MANWTQTNRIFKLYIFATLIGILIIVCVKTWHKDNETRQQFPLPRLADVRRHSTASSHNPLLVSPSPVTSEDLASIERYHAQERRWCEQKIANRTSRKWCPCIPPDLHGRVFVNMVDDSDWDRIVGAVGSDVQAGGDWKPKDCVPHTRLAIVVPCRDREHHLRILLRHLIPILKRQLIHFRVFVVDQRLPAIFNKAAAMNIGFLEAAKRFRFDCVIFHDVDMILEDDRSLMTCGPEPRHYAQAVDKFNYKLYPTFGGVVSVQREFFRRINGYPLRYFGWGGEDDDMWSRVSHFTGIYRPPATVARYSTIPHGKDATNQQNPQRHALMRTAFAENTNSSYEGLSDLIYAVNDVQLNRLFTRIQADLNITKLSYPSHPSSQYKRSAGICLDTDVIVTSGGMSWTSCRFRCDSLPNQPCFGFSYVKGICTVVRAACRLTLKENTWTYVKDVQFIWKKYSKTGEN